MGVECVCVSGESDRENQRSRRKHSIDWPPHKNVQIFFPSFLNHESHCCVLSFLATLFFFFFPLQRPFFSTRELLLARIKPPFRQLGLFLSLRLPSKTPWAEERCGKLLPWSLQSGEFASAQTDGWIEDEGGKKCLSKRSSLSRFKIRDNFSMTEEISQHFFIALQCHHLFCHLPDSDSPGMTLRFSKASHPLCGGRSTEFSTQWSAQVFAWSRIQFKSFHFRNSFTMTKHNREEPFSRWEEERAIEKGWRKSGCGYHGKKKKGTQREGKKEANLSFESESCMSVDS